MLKKSRLLEYLIANAEEIKRGVGKTYLSANFFVIALLKTITALQKGELPAILKGEPQKELEAVIRMLDKYDFVPKDAMNFILRTVSSATYKSSVEETLYRKHVFCAESEAKKRGSDTVDTLTYLQFILAEPTLAIYNNIKSKTKTGAPAKPSASTPSVRAIHQGETEAKSAPAEAPKPPVEKTPLGATKLGELVEQMKNIQDVLLSNMFGQDQAVNTFVSGYFQARLMSYERGEGGKPQATFLFAGPPGVGKTFLAEKVAEAVKLPYQRFDMSEYSDKEAIFQFAGSDKVYKNGAPGNVTDFVSKNPDCVLLFDEIEKAHINIIHLFLQILDAGRLRDSFTDEEVSFSNAIIIFTTNVGKNLYDDPTVANLSSLPRKKILKALAADVDPITKAPLFPSAICSRFASGNVVMFNHLEANNLFTIAKRELQKDVKGFEEQIGIKINVDDRVPSALMFAEGGKADARTVKGRANAFFHEEMYELLRLLGANEGADFIQKLTQINVTVPTEGMDVEIADMFENKRCPEVLIFANGNVSKWCTSWLRGRVIFHIVDNISAAKEVLFNRDISVVLCDVSCNIRTDVKLLNAEDIDSEGRDFLSYVLEKYSVAVYLLQMKENEISKEEFLSFAKQGVRDVLTVKSRGFADNVVEKCRIAYQQGKMLKLAKGNKSLIYRTSQTLSEDKKTAEIRLFDFRFNLITDVDDSKSVLDNVSKPDLTFDDVIGAEDAKAELKYFVEYLRDPIKYMRKGVRSPKGVLLYGPPGTGKTLLAKAMAGESGVTFLRAEGNEFLKRYVGEGPEAVHALFNAARKYAPSIVFVDEIDAIGKNRNDAAASDTSGDVLTSFLTEMDGFNTDTSKPVFVLAATNYSVDSSKGKSLDAALLRRFDRRIYVDLPNKEERKRYLAMKLKKSSAVKLSDEQLDNIAVRSTGMSLAELESVFEMALRNAIRSESGVAGDEEFEEAFETFNSGEKKEWDPETLMRTARHEAGHALICWLSGEKPSYLTIVARGDHGGYMQHADSEGKGIYTKAELLGKIRTALGGRASEIVYYGAEDGISTGASGDLYSATRTAEQMVCSYGMDATVGMSYIDMNTSVGASSQAVRDRVNAILGEELKNAIDIIEKNQNAINAIVDALLEKNHLKGYEIDEIFMQEVK